MKSRVTDRGQITIPKELRDRFGIHAGQAVTFHEEEGRIFLSKQALRDPVDALFGILPARQPTDRLLDELRGPPDLP